MYYFGTIMNRKVYKKPRNNIKLLDTYFVFEKKD